MKKILLSLIVTMCVLSCYAKGKSVRWEKPSVLAISKNYLSVVSVEFSDTATIVCVGLNNPDYNVSIPSTMFIVGDGGKHYPIRCCKEYALNKSVPVAHKSSVISLVFDPLPRKTKVFDIFCNNNSYSVRYWGVHNADKELKIPSFKIDESEVAAYRNLVLHPDTACITGRVENYNPVSGISSFNILNTNNITGESGPIVIPVAPDGTFSRKIALDYPMDCSLLTDKYNIIIPAFLQPGKTLDITIHADGSADYSTPSGMIPDCRAYLKNHSYNINFVQGGIKELLKQYDFVQYAELVENGLLKHLKLNDYIAHRYGYTSLDYLMASLSTKVKYCDQLIDYPFYFNIYGESLDVDKSVMNKQLEDMNNYRLFRQLPFDNYLLLGTPDFHMLQNYYSFCHRPLMEYRNDTYMSLSHAESDSALIHNDMQIFGQDKPSVLAKTSLLYEFQALGEKLYDENTIFEHIVPVIGKSYVSKKNLALVFPDGDGNYPTDEQLIEESKKEFRLGYKYKAEVLQGDMLLPYAEKMKEDMLAPKNQSVPLPECEATTMLRKITDQFKGKYVFLDFWGTSCGPCRSGIERTESMREAMKDNHDVEFVFITSESNSPLSAYDKYVAKHLTNGKVFRVPDAEYKKYMELFRFLGIPHYETLDRNGNLLKGVSAPENAESLLQFIEQLDKNSKKKITE